MIKVIDKEVLSSDNTHQLVGKIYLPQGNPRGLLHVVHGMTEHIGRYDKFMREMAEDDYIVFGYDHLGHGKTALGRNELGYIADHDGWKLLVDDVFRFGNAVRRAMGNGLPFILMGHSMGSFIVRLTAEKYNHYDKLIIMGTGGPNPIAGLGIGVTAMMKVFKGKKSYSPLVEKMAFGAYNKRFEDEHDKLSWLSIDIENRERYRADPFCTFHFTVSAMQDLIRLNSYSNKKSWFDAIDKTKPILLVSGSEDPVGDNGEGIKRVDELLRAAGANVSMKLYEGYRHEILNDACRTEVIKDIKQFIAEG